MPYRGGMPAVRLRRRATSRLSPYPCPEDKKNVLQMLREVARIKHKPVVNKPPSTSNYAAAAANMQQLCATASERVTPQNHVVTFSILTERQIMGAVRTPAWQRSYYMEDSWTAVNNRRIAMRVQIARARDVPLTDVSTTDPELVKRMLATPRDAPRLLINLQKMVGLLRAAAANKENFSAAIVWTGNPASTALAFGSARLVCTGAKSVEDAQEAADMYVEIFKRAVPLDFGMHNFGEFTTLFLKKTF